MKEAFHNNDKIEEMFEDNVISAGGDAGDLSFIMPVTSSSYSGFASTYTGNSFLGQLGLMISGR